MKSPESKGFIRQTVTAIAAVGALATMTGCDNPFKDDAKPTMHQLFVDENQACANEAAADVASQITPQALIEADSIKALLAQANKDAADATDACVVDRTGIPLGTEGFVVRHPLIALDANAAVVTEG